MSQFYTRFDVVLPDESPSTQHRFRIGLFLARE